jgi:hypothetical protein
MNNRINVNKEIQESINHEQFAYVIIGLVGVILPVSLWLVNFKKIESDIWQGFFTVVMILITVVSFLFSMIKITRTSKAVSNYRKVLTKYASINERTYIPETAYVTTCLRPDVGRFGFQKINYFFWKDETELVFFPVRPDFLTSKAYHLVQSVRLNEVMVRSYAMAGNQYYDGIKDDHEIESPSMTKASKRALARRIYRDTRATLIAYAVGKQTVYLMFDIGLYEVMKELIPEKDQCRIDALAKMEAEISIPSTTDKTPKLPITDNIHEWEN